VRLSCPPGAPCRAQSPPPPGDGCGADLDWWFSAEPYKEAPTPDQPPKEVMMADLPAACRTVLEAAPVAGTMTMLQAYAAGTGRTLPVAAAPAMQAIEQAAAAEEENPNAARLPRPRPEGR
jgi:penicillin-insensitive murein endopeptidase